MTGSRDIMTSKGNIERRISKLEQKRNSEPEILFFNIKTDDEEVAKKYMTELSEKNPNASHIILFRDVGPRDPSANYKPTQIKMENPE